jgi:hypothetical protein
MVAGWHDWKHLDRPKASFAEIEAATPTYLPGVMQMSQRGLKEAIDDAFNCVHLDHTDSDD